jgi:hypothetical protein
LKNAVADAAAKEAAKQVARGSAPEANALGLHLRPSDIANATDPGKSVSRTARLAEAAGGSAELRRDYIRKNIPAQNSAVAQQLGLPPGTTLTPAAREQAKLPHAAVYQEAEAVPPLPFDDDFRQQVASAGRGTHSKLDLPPEAAKLQEKLLDGTTWTSPEVLDTMSDLRQKGNKALLSTDPNTEALGHAQLDMAKALEKHMDKAAVLGPDPTLGARFKKAREGFAQIYAADAATGIGYDVSPADLRKLQEKTGELTGAMKGLAQANAHFEHVVTNKIPEASGHPLARAMYYAAPVAVGAAGGGLTGAILAGTLVPAAQAGLRKAVTATSGAAKQAKLGLGGPLSYLEREPKARPPIALVPPEGTVGVRPNQQGLDLQQPDASPYGGPLGLRPPPGRAWVDPQQQNMGLDERIFNMEHVPGEAPPIDPAQIPFDLGDADTNLLIKALRKKGKK